MCILFVTLNLKFHLNDNLLSSVSMYWKIPKYYHILVLILKLFDNRKHSITTTTNLPNLFDHH